MMFRSQAVCFILFFWNLLTTSAFPSSRKASFVPAATPTIAQSAAVSTGYGLYPASTTTLYGKKKGQAAAPKKVQVKLLKHIAGTGQAGDVIQVTPAFFNNKLRPTKAAEVISDEEVEKERAESAAKQKEIDETAAELQEKVGQTTLVLSRKAGPDGQLFGGIGPKLIMSELQNVLESDYLKEKWVKVSEVLDENGKKIRGDIKHTGTFGARISLKKDVSAKVAIEVQAED